MHVISCSMAPKTRANDLWLQPSNKEKGASLTACRGIVVELYGITETHFENIRNKDQIVHNMYVYVYVYVDICTCVYIILFCPFLDYLNLFLFLTQSGIWFV